MSNRHPRQHQHPPSSSKSLRSPTNMEHHHSQQHGSDNSQTTMSLPYRVAQSASGLAHDVFGLGGNDASSTLAANLQMSGKSGQVNTGPSLAGPVTDPLMGSGARPGPCADPARMAGPSFKSPFSRQDESNRAFEEFASLSPGGPALQNPSIVPGHDLRGGAAHLRGQQGVGQTSHAQAWPMEFTRLNAFLEATHHTENVEAPDRNHDQINPFGTVKHESRDNANSAHFASMADTTSPHDQAPSYDCGPLRMYEDQLRALEAQDLEKIARLRATVPDFDVRNGSLPRPDQETPPSQAQSREPNQAPSLVDGLRSSLNARRITLDSPTHEVLPVTLKNYAINEDPAIYSLYVIHDDQERLLGRDDRPLRVFRQLTDEGKKPMFMLRKLEMPPRRSDRGSGQMKGWFSSYRPRIEKKLLETRYTQKAQGAGLVRSFPSENASEVKNLGTGSSPPSSDQQQQKSAEAQRGRAWVGQITAMSAKHDDVREEHQAGQNSDDQMDTLEDLVRQAETREDESEAPSKNRTRSPHSTSNHQFDFKPEPEPKPEPESFSQSTTSRTKASLHEDYDAQVRLLVVQNKKRLQLAREQDAREQEVADQRARERNGVAQTPQTAVKEQEVEEDDEEEAKQSRPVRRLKMVLAHIPLPRTSIPTPAPPSQSSSPSVSPSPSPPERVYITTTQTTTHKLNGRFVREDSEEWIRHIKEEAEAKEEVDGF